ncbi:hypothetical protein Tco_0493424 [Tanacetum coccineum]
MAQQIQIEEQEKLSIEDKSKLFVQLLEARKKHFVAIRAKEKRNKPPTKAQKRNTMQKVDEDKETTELQRLIEVVPDKEEVESLQALEDLETLWKLVKAKHGSTRPEEGYKRVLWGDLKTMFDPHVENQGRIVGIKRLYDDLEVTAAKVCVTVAKLNTTRVKLVLLVKIEENILSSYYCLLRVNAASTKLQLLKDKDCLKIKITYEIRIVIYRIDL